MHNVYIYESDADDFSSIGLVGALLPITCEHEEEAGGTSAITMEHPFDETGKWKSLVRGRILKAMTRVRAVPEIQGNQVVTSVEIWTVKSTATKEERGVYSKETGGRRKKTLQAGIQVVVVRKEENRYKIQTIQEVRLTSLRPRKTGGGVSGWIAASALDYDTTEEITNIEDVAAPWVLREQLFRITDVQKDTASGKLVVFAPHISYDLIGNNTRFDTRDMEPYKTRGDETITAQETLDGILNNCDFSHEFKAFTDLANTRAAAQYRNQNPLQALLDKENGFCERFGAQLVRDDFELYLLAKAGRNRGLRIEYGGNLLGVDFETNLDELVTAIKPVGETKDGKDLYLTDDATSPNNYVLSPHVNEYPIRYCHVLKCEDCKVDGKQLTKTLVRARMREQAEQMFEDECDLPNVNLTVKFILLGDTEEFAQYRDLDRIYLWDEVSVLDKTHGIEVLTEVQRIVVDCLTGRVMEAELGNVRECAASLSAWQIPTLDGHKLQSGSVPGVALEDESIPPEKLDPELQEALNQAFADIESAQTLLTDTRTWLDTVEATTETMQSAVTDNAGNITALRQTATEIRAGLTDAENNLAAVQLTAGQLQTSMSNAQGEISTIRQSANEMSSTISDMQTSISSIRQTANGAYSSVAALDGRVQSLVTQIAEGVAVKLKDGSIDGTFEAVVGTAASYYYGPGIEFRYGSSGNFMGGLFMHYASTSTDLVLHSENGLELMAYGNVAIANGATGLVLMDMTTPSGEATTGVQIEGHFVPAQGGIYSLGFNASGKRFNNVNISGSVNTASDRRLKTELGAPDANWLLEGLTAKAYRLKSDPAKVRFGFFAQDVLALLKSAGHEDYNLFNGDDPESLSLCYTELIAVLVEGWQRHEKEIEALRARIERLEAAHEHSD